MKNHTKGFTLVEILIVVAIIGILASVALIGLGPVQRKGRDTRRISDMKQVQSGLELYFSKNGHYPTGIAQWSDLQTMLGAAGISVSNIPNDPRTGANYCYASDSAGTTYVIEATFEDTTNPALGSSNYTGAVPSGGGQSCTCGSPNYCVAL